MNNIEVGYKPIATQNMFGAIESEDDDDEEWPALKPLEPQTVKMAKKEAFWVRAQAKEKERKLKAKEEDELMQSLIDSSESLLPTTSFQSRMPPKPQRSERRVRFCEDFVGCNDDCCAGGAEDESSCKSDTPLLTAQGDAPLGSTLGEGWVSCVSEAAGLAASSSGKKRARGDQRYRRFGGSFSFSQVGKGGAEAAGGKWHQ